MFARENFLSYSLLGQQQLFKNIFDQCLEMLHPQMKPWSRIHMSKIWNFT